jgi:hypothetical protein
MNEHGNTRFHEDVKRNCHGASLITAVFRGRWAVSLSLISCPAGGSAVSRDIPYPARAAHSFVRRLL